MECRLTGCGNCGEVELRRLQGLNREVAALHFAPLGSFSSNGSVPFVLVPALVLIWHNVKIVIGRTIVGGARVVSGAEKQII